MGDEVRKKSVQSAGICVKSKTTIRGNQNHTQKRPTRQNQKNLINLRVSA